VHALIALVAAAAVLALLGFGFGTVPPLGPALDPARGAWTSAAGGGLPRSQTLHLPGLAHPVSVSFTAQGVPSIQAGSLADLPGLPTCPPTSSSCGSACCRPPSGSGRTPPGPALRARR
jgi:acyl-homoserine lactone acylase PvdQ